MFKDRDFATYSAYDDNTRSPEELYQDILSRLDWWNNGSSPKSLEPKAREVLRLQQQYFPDEENGIELALLLDAILHNEISVPTDIIQAYLGMGGSIDGDISKREPLWARILSSGEVSYDQIDRLIRMQSRANAKH